VAWKRILLADSFFSYYFAEGGDSVGCYSCENSDEYLNSVGESVMMMISKSGSDYQDDPENDFGHE